MRLYSEHLGEGPRVVLVHGFTQTGRCWARWSEDLADDHEVVLVDAPGHGRSAGVHCDLPTGAALLGAAGGAGTYVGYSMGGRLALHLALARPDLVHALVLIGATPGIEDAAERAARRAADDALAADLERDGVDAFLQRWLDQPLFSSLPAEASAIDERRRNTVEGLAASLRLAGTGAQAPLWDRLDELPMPVLALAGDQDVKFAAIGRRMVDAIGPNAAFALVPDAGHAAHLEQPATSLALVRTWLQAQRATT